MNGIIASTNARSKEANSMENTSKVSDLIEILKDLDKDKEIRFVAVCGWENAEGDVNDLEIDLNESKNEYTIYI